MNVNGKRPMRLRLLKSLARWRCCPTLDASPSWRALLLRLGLARAAAAPEVTALASSPGLFKGN